MNQKLLLLWRERLELEKKKEKEIVDAIKGVAWKCVCFSSLFFFLSVLVINLYREKEGVPKSFIMGLVFFFLLSYALLTTAFFFSCSSFGSFRRVWIYDSPEWEGKEKEIDKEIIEELKKQPETDQEKNQVKEEKDEPSISNENPN